MASYSMTCSCGETMTCEANSRDEAVKALQAGMTEANIAEHMSTHHAGEPVPSVAQVHGMIAELVK